MDKSIHVTQWRFDAERGSPIAQNKLGLLYKNGHNGGPKDYQQAVSWFRKAAYQGSPDAQNNLGLMYAHGKGALQDPRRPSSGSSKRQNRATPTLNLTSV